jgi:hypothetical protein
VLGGGICECLWLGDNDVTLSMVKRAYQNFNTTLSKFDPGITLVFNQLARNMNKLYEYHKNTKDSSVEVTYLCYNYISYI